MSEETKWIHFTESAQLSQFVDGIFCLYVDLIQKLAQDEVPFFYDYWLTRLNQCDVWMLCRGKIPMALVSKPKVKDIHLERWQYNTLVVGSRFSDPLNLPFPTAKPVAFLVPTGDYTAIFKDRFSSSVFQRCYSRTTTSLAKGEMLSNVKFQIVTSDTAKSVIPLFDRDYHWEGQSADYIESVKAEILNATSRHSGWCVMATRDLKPIAVASYLGLPTPLLGVASAIVGDLLVVSEERGKGIASNLQLYAYDQLRLAGVRWINGTIDPENKASIRQAIRVGRSPLYDVLVLHPNA